MPEITSNELSILEALAKSATPGEWVRARTFGKMQDRVTLRNGEILAYTYHTGDSAFISAANPTTVLHLIFLVNAYLSGNALPCYSCAVSNNHRDDDCQSSCSVARELHGLGLKIPKNRDLEA